MDEETLRKRWRGLARVWLPWLRWDDKVLETLLEGAARARQKEVAKLERARRPVSEDKLKAIAERYDYTVEEVRRRFVEGGSGPWYDR